MHSASLIGSSSPLPAGGDAYRIRVFLQIDARGADALPQRPARTVFIDSRAENDDGVQPSGGFWNAPENTRHSTARNTATAAITTMFTARSHGRGIGALFPCFHAHFQRKKRPKHTADSISQR